MSSDQLMALAAALTTLGSIIVAVIAYRERRRASEDARGPATQTASAAEVDSLGERLDKQTERLDIVERRMRGLYAYIADDHADHRLNGWPIRPLPEDLA